MAKTEWDDFAKSCEATNKASLVMGDMLNGERITDDFLIEQAKTGNLWLLRLVYCFGAPSLKTFVCEHMGEVPREQHDEAEVALLLALRHESPVVREGAVIGLAAIERGHEALRSAAENDESPGVREAASNALIYYDDDLPAS